MMISLILRGSRDKYFSSIPLGKYLPHNEKVNSLIFSSILSYCWKYFTCEMKFYIDKIVSYGLTYILNELILMLQYSFGKQ